MSSRRLVQLVFLHKVVFGELLTRTEKCSCSDCTAVMRRHEDGVGLLQSGSIEGIDSKLVCERNDGNLTHGCSSFCARDCRATLPKKFSASIPCESNPGTPRSAKGISLSQLSVAYKIMASCPEPLPCICTCNCPPIVYGTPLPPPPLPPFATASPPQLSVGLMQTPTAIPQEAAMSMYARMQQDMSSPGITFTQVAEHVQKLSSQGVPDIVLGPPLPPAPPLPPPVARGACPKSAGCNCYFPCRGEPQR